MQYDFKAIPEAAWSAFSLAVAGLVGAICVAAGADDGLTVAITAFVGAALRLVVSGLISVTTPPAEGGQTLTSTAIIVAALLVAICCVVWLFGPFEVGR